MFVNTGMSVILYVEGGQNGDLRRVSPARVDMSLGHSCLWRDATCTNPFFSKLYDATDAISIEKDEVGASLQRQESATTGRGHWTPFERGRNTTSQGMSRGAFRHNQEAAWRKPGGTMRVEPRCVIHRISIFTSLLDRLLINAAVACCLPPSSRPLKPSTHGQVSTKALDE